MAINLKYLKNGIIMSTGWMVPLAFIFSCGNPTDNPEPQFLLADDQLPLYEKAIDHATLISREYTREIKESGLVIYRTTCFSCHGDEEQSGSLPNSKKFWEESFKNGNDPYSLYQTMTRGFDQMPPQMHLVPSQKYDVIQFIREEFIRENNPDQYFEIDKKYLARLPKGVTAGPSPQPYHPWADLDYGNWLIHCYELADDSDPPKSISKGRAPLPNEDYSDVNFAYKGIAVRLDSGVGGIAKGKAFALFDHDLMRMTGVWTGEGFIDWADILLNDVHNVYPRTVGKRHFENPIKPGWANPANGSFEDPRMRGLDGRPFGPLPRRWAHYKGLYRYNDDVIIRYTVGNANILETWSLESSEGEYVFSRSLSLSKVNTPLKLLVAPDSVSVKLLSERGNLVKENGFYLVNIPPLNSLNLKLVISGMEQSKLDDFSINVAKPEALDQFTKGSPKKYDQSIQSLIIPGNDDDPYAVDVFVLPEPNPWKSRVRLTGIDFIKSGDEAVVCTIDGEVWRIEGILSGEGNATWHRMATGLYQPLGIKVVQDQIYVGCRDQIVILRDLNDDGETDFYESFNSDHQVTEHFHEFAMGLETDDAGNFYYAKSGRHARTSLVPQHGTLIKVSADGFKTEILANGFRAANGICLNPDGSFYVTDQEGFWNPMNRINRVREGGFYGNMWGYGAPEDSSDAAMIPPTIWVDMKYDRSPAELLWADSDRWGPLNGSLLNLSYGYGKIFNVLTQDVGGVQQGGLIELPVSRFPTGIMRARFNPIDGQMYVCGMSAWATDQMLQVGGLYRVRYTGKPFYFPVDLKAVESGLKIVFSDQLDKTSVENVENYTINAWDIKRTSKYGSDRYNTRSLSIERAVLEEDQKTVHLLISEMELSWIMETIYTLKSHQGKPCHGAIQHTVYGLAEDSEF